MEPIPAKYARRKFQAFRDAHGVPHVDAPSWREALYALGYLHALDRPTQILFGRAVASGRGAEQIAETGELIETDRFFRRAGLYLQLDREVHGLCDSIFDQLTFYCEGVNDGMKHGGRSLPMWASGFRPQPWNHQAVLLIGNLLSYAGLAVSQQQNERLLVELIQLGIDDARLKELFSPRLDHADFDLLRRVKISSQLSDEALELITDLPRLAGSNAWAVSPERTKASHALLACDPHLEVNRLPAIWYEVVLRWTASDSVEDHPGSGGDGPGHRYVMGASLPGCPLLAVGRTERLAWGVTYMKGDTSDYFIEECRPGGSAGWQFRRDDSWHDFRVRREMIHRKGNTPEMMRIYENDLGTIDGNPDEDGPGFYLTLSWIGAGRGAGRSIGTWLDVVHAGTTAEAMDMVRACPMPSLMWIIADRQGHIGKQGCGWFPRRRKGHNGLVPIPAWDERNHWRGTIPSEKLPREFDPKEGFLATANENINSATGPQWITQIIPDYRQRRIVERLAQMPEATVQDMQALQYDVMSVHARDLLPIFLPHLPEGSIKQRLATWDFRYAPESKEATLFQHFYRNVVLEVFGHEKGIGWLRMLYLCTRVGYSTMVLTSIDNLLKKEHSLWWQNRDKGELIRRAARHLEREKDEPWSVTNAFHFVNRFFEGRRVGRMLGFHTSEMPMPGCHATPFQGHLLKTATRETSFAPSYHFVTDLGTDSAWTNLPGGPSESRFSKYYKNDIPLWASGRYKELNASSASEILPTPRPQQTATTPPRQSA
jgi:penicillin amidase